MQLLKNVLIVRSPQEFRKNNYNCNILEATHYYTVKFPIYITFVLTGRFYIHVFGSTAATH